MAKRKQKQPTYEEKGVRYMMCTCGSYVSVDETAVDVKCSHCVTMIMMNKYPHEEPKSYKPTGRPAGWHFMKEFVDKDGNVFHKGKEQPKLFGTLPSTKVQPKKKTKRRTKEQILIARHKKKKMALKKAKKLSKRKLKNKLIDEEKSNGVKR
jgi:hypothetical protein